MGKTLKLVLIASIIIFCKINNIYGQTYEKTYNLNFKIVDNTFHGWHFDVNNSAIHFLTDTTDLNRPIKFSQKETWGFREKMDFNMYSSKILLPPLSNNILKVGISYKSKNLKTGKLFVYSLDEGMEIIKTDSICLQNDDKMRENFATINTKELRFLFFRLQAIGKDSTYTENKIMPIKKTIPHEISISQIWLQDGNTKINTLPFQDITPSNLDKSKILTLSFDTLLTKEQLSHISKKITALGETVHGSGKIGWATTNYIKSSILTNDTKLILTELPTLQMLFFNKYIHGSNSIDEDKLKEIIEKNPIEVEPIIELSKWLRNYNKTAIEKVNYLGIDNQYERNELYLFLKDYLQTLNNEVGSLAVDSIISVLQITDVEKIKDMAKTTLHIIENNQQELCNVLGEDLMIITFYLKSLIGAEIKNEKSYYKRDCRMFKNASFFIDNLCTLNQTIVVNCHLGHANYMNIINIPYHKSFGHYMKKSYGDDYACIVQTVYQDTAKALLGKELVKRDLLMPSKNSLEAIFEKSGIKYGYIDSKELDDIVKIRLQGLFHNQNLLKNEDYINPQLQTDGFLFINY